MDSRHLLVALLCVSFFEGIAPITVAPIDLDNVNLKGLITGPYDVKKKEYKNVAGLDSTDPHIVVYYPLTTEKNVSFPFISYSHGWGGGGLDFEIAYDAILKAMAGFGYIIGGAKSCNFGCHDDKVDLPHDPPGFGDYYKEQQKTITWAKEQQQTHDPVFDNVDFSMGVGIAGHSMGGQATLFSSSYKNASDFDVRAAVYHHPYTHSWPAAEIPFIAFCGAKDLTAPSHPMSFNIYENPESEKQIRAIVNKADADHHEPDVLGYNPLLAQYSVAWFKLYLDKTPQAYGFDFEEMIYGKSPDTSVCFGGDGDMVPGECLNANQP